MSHQGSLSPSFPRRRSFTQTTLDVSLYSLKVDPNDPTHLISGLHEADGIVRGRAGDVPNSRGDEVSRPRGGDEDVSDRPLAPTAEAGERKGVRLVGGRHPRDRIRLDGGRSGVGVERSHERYRAPSPRRSPDPVGTVLPPPRARSSAMGLAGTG